MNPEEFYLLYCLHERNNIIVSVQVGFNLILLHSFVQTTVFNNLNFYRKDTRSLFIRNSTLLPVAWRVNGMENLGDDFSLSSDHGVIDPRQECEVKLHFRAVKVINVKKNIRIEVRVF